MLASEITRRALLASAGALAVSPVQGAAFPIVDTHTHFYDPARPGGVPWPHSDDATLYRTVLPSEFRRMTQPLGVTGTVVVEASPLLEDNQWILDLAAKNPVMLGLVGHLDPGKPGFGANLGRFHKNQLFLGIRLGGGAIAGGLENAQFIADLKTLASAGLELDAIGGDALLGDVARLTDRVPGLRVVINHLPFEPAAPEAALRELAQRPGVYAKVSNVVRKAGSAASYHSELDRLWDLFGPDRAVYGSNWPVSDKVAPYTTVFGVVRKYFEAKGREASAKFFWRNAKAVYRWPGKP